MLSLLEIRMPGDDAVNGMVAHSDTARLIGRTAAYVAVIGFGLFLGVIVGFIIALGTGFMQLC